MDYRENEPIVSFTLARYPTGRAGLQAMAHLGLDRWPLAHTPGLRFWRLLGVGQGQTFTPQTDLQRYALFAVWQSEEALHRFEAESAVMRRIRQRSAECWTVHMRPVRWHGQWGGRDPFAGMPVTPAPQGEPWIILTRATVRPSQWHTFLRAIPPVSEQLLQQPDLLRSVGIGEAPRYFQGTLSVWRTLPAVTGFAYGTASEGMSPHAGVIKRTRREQWYHEELFARLRPLASRGSWGGSNPLA